MKRKILLALLCMLLPGAWLCPLLADTGPQKKATKAGYIIWEPQITSGDQFSFNSVHTDYSVPYTNLIDGDVNTYFHSVWDAGGMKNASITEDEWVQILSGLYNGVNTDPGYHNIQVALGAPVSTFRFEYKGNNNATYHDNPNHVVIYATNDPSVAASTSNSNQDQWTFITELTPENGNFPANEVVIREPYQSPEITMPEPFQYLRFVIKGTTNQNQTAERTFAAPDVTGVTFDISEFQVYAPRESTGPADELQALVDSVQNMWNNNDYQIGTDPGYVDADKYAAAYSAWEVAESAVFNGAADSECAEYLAQLRAALTDFIENGIHGVDTGYYYFINCYPDYQRLQGVTKSMCVNAQGELGWANTDSLDATQLWYVEKLDNGYYSIKNVASGQYIGSVKGVSKRVPMTATHVTDQTITADGSVVGQYHIANVLNDIEYHTEGHENGVGISGRIVTYDGLSNSASVWLLHKPASQEIIDKLLAEGSTALLRENMSLALDSANTSRMKANEYTKLITRADQISSNAYSTGDGSTYAGLIDNNTNTIFHSVWEAAMAAPTVLGESYGWHNLQFTLDEPVSQITFEFRGRVSSGGYWDTPDHMTLYGTNDDALGASTAAADSAQWDMIADMTDDVYNFPGRIPLAHYMSPVVDLGGSYKYLRFVVKHTVTMEPGAPRASSFMSPQATGVTFNFSEFQIYDPTPTEKSQYYTVPGMKEACDALEAAITASQEKLAAGTVTEADIAALQTAYRLVDTLYVDRSGLYTELKSLLETGTNLYDQSTGSRVALISDVSQLSTNSVDPAEGGLDAMIDGDITTSFNSVWNVAMREPTTTKESWEELILNTYSESLGAGYHNLSVSLAAPVKSFFFEYFSRYGTEYHDNPTDIEIYATNDASLYDDVRADGTSKWQFITELTEGFPTGGYSEIPYTSPVIELNGEYKYIRFVVKNTSTANNHEDNPGVANNRDFVVPEITGITWNVAEFQMYTGLDPESIQYNYIEEVRVAADELKEVMDKYAGFTASDINSEAPVDELAAAVKKLQEAYVDTTEVCGLYKEYKEILSRGITEGDLVGDVDDYSAVETFDAALDNGRALIDPKRPTKEQVNAATDVITSSYEEFMSHVIMPEPYVWYVIRSGSTREYALDQPVYLGDVSAGAKLWIGPYPLDGTGNEYRDIYAIWRLVPVEGNEPAEGEEPKPWEQKYAIQSLGTGQYWGPYRGPGADNSPLMSNEQTPYNIYFYGMGCFALQQEGVEDPFDRIKADGTEFVVLNYPANGDHQQAWRFDDVLENSGDMVNINWFPAQSTSIITLPFDLTGDNMISNINGDIKTYAINSVVENEAAEGDEPSYTLTLTEKFEFEAGEPFVIETLAEPDANGQQPLVFILPPAEADAIVDTSAVDYNGLVGTLEGLTIKGQASLYFENSILNVATDAGYTIPGRSGYIDVTKVKDLGGSIDKTITINGVINNIKNVEIVDNENEIVDVYTIDGVLIKRNVKAAEATRNLAKGIYIVGKKKVLVK